MPRPTKQVAAQRRQQLIDAVTAFVNDHPAGEIRVAAFARAFGVAPATARLWLLAAGFVLPTGAGRRVGSVAVEAFYQRLGAGGGLRSPTDP